MSCNDETDKLTLFAVFSGKKDLTMLKMRSANVGGNMTWIPVMRAG